MSPGKWSPIPRASGPEFLARWADRSGFWRLVILDRSWDVTDSVYTNHASNEPRPEDQWLARLGFVPADGGWAEVDGGWERAVGRAPKSLLLA